LSTGRIERRIVTNQRSLGGNYDGSAAKTEGFAEAGSAGRQRATAARQGSRSPSQPLARLGR